MYLFRVSICLLVAGGLTGSSLRAQAPSHLKYVPSSAFVAATAKPKSALAEPVMELVPREIIQVFGQKELGLDLLELERITVLVDEISDPQMSSPPEVGIIASFATPQNIGGNAVNMLEPTTINGRKAFSLDGEAVLVHVDDQTLVFGSPDFVDKMLNNTGASSPLIELLKSQPDSDHLSMHVAVPPIREMIKENLPPAEQLPPPFQRYLKLPDMVQSVSYRSSFSSGSAEELIFKAVDAQSAKEMASMVQQAIGFAKSMGLSMLGMETGIEDPIYQQAIMDYTDRMAELVETKLGPRIEGEQVVFSLGGGGGYAGLTTLGMAMGMLVPAVSQAGEAAQRVDSANRLRQILIAAHNYHEVHKRFPGNTYDDNGKPLLSWRVQLLPYLEENALSQQFHMDEPWDSAHNQQLLDPMPDCYRHPMMELGNRTVFLGVSGEGMAFDGIRKIRFQNFRDGVSNTVVIVEADESEAQHWTKPADWTVGENDPLRGLGGIRPSGFNVAFGDGSVQLISALIDPEVWKALCTIGGGEIIDQSKIDR